MRPIKEYEVVIKIPVATFNRKTLDAKHIRDRLVDAYLRYIVQGDVMIDDDCVEVTIVSQG